MKIFLSGYLSNYRKLDPNLVNNANLLNAFSELSGKKDAAPYLEIGKELFLDSGGYTIRTRGLKLSVYDYVNYIKKYGDKYSVIANMDTASVKETLENQKILEGETGRIITPVYHASDFFEGNIGLLEHYLSNYDYIALGGVAGVVRNWSSNKKIMRYLGTVFTKAKQTKTKIHGFGMTANNVLKAFPFYSVDSTSRLSCTIYGEYHYFQNGNIKVINLKNQKMKLGINHAAHKTEVRLNTSLENWLKFEKYITTLQQVKGMEYWN